MSDGQVWTVYRYYDAAGRLLYVGATGSGYYRAHGHARSGAAWWPLVARGEFEHFATMAEAYSAELRQIVQLSPLFNRADNPQWQGPRAVREPDAPIRPRVEAYLAQLDQGELARMTRGELAEAMAGQGVDVSVRYAGQLLDEWRAGLPTSTWRGERRTPEGRPMSRVRLPAAPLLAAVDAAVGRPRPGWTTRLRRSVGESGVRSYERAQQEGSLTLRRVERFCDRFGWHPRELYGDAYDAAALAGCPADFDPWQGVA